MTPRAKKVIEYAMEEARNLNHKYVGTEHILLGLLREQEGVAAQILMNLGLKLDEVRDEIKALLGHGLSEGGRNVAEPPEPLPEPPAVCPKCGQPRVVRVLWNWVHLWGQKEEDVRLGKAILAARDNAGGPPWVCLQCAPGWSRSIGWRCKSGNGSLPRKRPWPPPSSRRPPGIGTAKTNSGSG